MIPVCKLTTKEIATSRWTRLGKHLIILTPVYFTNLFFRQIFRDFEHLALGDVAVVVLVKDLEGQLGLGIRRWFSTLLGR